MGKHLSDDPWKQIKVRESTYRQLLMIAIVNDETMGEAIDRLCQLYSATLR